MKRTTDYASKPYNRCLQCHLRIERKCDGARTSAMKLDRWCEFMRDMKTVNGLTNVEIAEKSGVSLKTIEKLMAQNCTQDIMRETARLIEEAVLGSGNQYPCYLAFEETHSAEAAAKSDASPATSSVPLASIFIRYSTSAAKPKMPAKAPAPHRKAFPLSVGTSQVNSPV